MMHIRDSLMLLEPIARSLDPLDILIHDSLYTRDHMRFEFEHVFPFMRTGGILVADDALWNKAFPEFAAKVRAPAARILRGVGVLRKGVE